MDVRNSEAPIADHGFGAGGVDVLLWLHSTIKRERQNGRKCDALPVAASLSGFDLVGLGGQIAPRQMGLAS